jgi:aryl-alcohol dehydrogenase-like predicted oxidoreductase
MSIDRVVLGSADLRGGDAAPVLERFREAGGRRLDLANVYGEGESMRAVGSWLDASGTRDELVLYAKGCHPPQCAPAFVAGEVEVARSSLGVDHLDAFVLHRDDPAVGVEVWAAALLAEVERGSVTSFGISNWTLERFRALRAALGPDAAKLAVFSNHFSLAEMVAPTWPGCLAMSRAEISEIAATGTTVLAWAGLAGGYFAGRELESWESAENGRRRERAGVIARDAGVGVPAVALAYLLGQPDDLLVAVGTRSVDHLDELLAATELRLGADELRWLERGGVEP